jgi:hypothetical protein
MLPKVDSSENIDENPLLRSTSTPSSRFMADQLPSEKFDICIMNKEI